MIDLEEDETVRLDLFEGHNRRLATIRGAGREELKIAGETVPARIFALRIDKVSEGELYEERPEMDVRVWVSEDDRRVILRSRGTMSGVGATIRLVRRTVAPPPETNPKPDPEPSETTAAP